MPDSKAVHFRIRGMDCAEEVAILRREVGALVGGEQNLSFDLLQGRMTVIGQPDVDFAAIQRQVGKTGMQALRWEEEAGKAETGFWWSHGRLFLTLVSGGSILAAFLTHVGLVGNWAGALGLGASPDKVAPWSVRSLYLLAVFSGGWYVLPKAWLAARRLHPDMNLLMTIAVAGALVIGQWLEAATVSFLFSLSLLLESWSIGRARRAVESLFDLAPPSARVLSSCGNYVEVPVSEVGIGRQVLIRPGERVPLDGSIISGTSHLNQAPITGESIPVARGPGDEVFAGTVNGEAALEIVTTHEAEDTTLAHIIRLVSEARHHRAPSEKWVEKFARYYTPSIFGSSFLVLLLPPLLLGASWDTWIYRSLVLLVIGCPCALVISTPVSIVAALAAAARQGILIKGGVHLETPARLRALAFDKTGTLTTGQPKVTGVIPLSGHMPREVLERAAALESRSSHPLALAILDHARSQGLQIQHPEEFQILPGRGATGRLNQERFWLGSHRYLEERGQDLPELRDRLNQLCESGQSVVIVGQDEHVCGFLTLADQVRPRANETLQELRRLGIERLLLLTGDNQATARMIGQQAGVGEIHAELLPGDKVEVVEHLVSEYGPGRVAMVGDGVNDAPAMARASLGIAMAAVGSDTAIEASDIALMSDDLQLLPWLIRHSRRTLNIIRQNVGSSIAVKLLFATLTFSGFASLWAAIASDMGVSLLVIFNALRLLRPRG